MAESRDAGGQSREGLELEYAWHMMFFVDSL